MSKRTHSNLLIDETPLQIVPSLAVAVGLHDAMILQQIHWFLRPNAEKASGKVVDGKRWIFNTYADWKRQYFPFLSEKQIGDAIRRLEAKGLILSRADLNRVGSDRRKWYTIDYDAYNRFIETWDVQRTSGDDGNPDTHGDDQDTSGDDDQGTPAYDGQDTPEYDVLTERRKETTKRQTKNTPANADGTPDPGPDDTIIEADFIRLGKHSMAEAGMTPTGEPLQPVKTKPVSVQGDHYASAKDRSYALASAFFKGRGLKKADVPARQWHATAKVMADLPERYTEEDVTECVRYMLTDAWNREGDRLTAKRVVAAIPVWVHNNRPESVVPRGRPNNGALTGDDWRHVAQQLRGQGE